MLDLSRKPTAEEISADLHEMQRQRGLSWKIHILGTAKFMAIAYPGQHYLWLIHPDEGQR